MKKIIIALLLMLIAVPVLAFPGEGLIKWLANQTGLTEELWTWIGTAVILPALGGLMVKTPWDKWEKFIYTFFYNGAKRLNIMILGLPLYIGIAWEKFLEPFVIKWITGLFRILAVIPIAIAAGFNSEGESLAGDK